MFFTEALPGGGGGGGGGTGGGVHVAHLNLRKFFVFVGIGEKGDSDAL